MILGGEIVVRGVGNDPDGLGQGGAQTGIAFGGGSLQAFAATLLVARSHPAQWKLLLDERFVDGLNWRQGFTVCEVDEGRIEREHRDWSMLFFFGEATRVVRFVGRERCFAAAQHDNQCVCDMGYFDVWMGGRDASLRLSMTIPLA
jgi:hypothetical protein